MEKEELALSITKIQNEQDWIMARDKLMNLMSNTCKTKEDFELFMEEIQNRDWIF